MVDVGSIISQGFRRTFKRNGLISVGLMALFSILGTVAAQSVQRALNPVTQSSFGTLMNVSAYPLALNMPTSAAAVFYTVTTIASAVAAIGIIRTLVSDETEKLPVENFTRNLPLALLNLIGGWIVFIVVLGLGAGIPVLPGAVLYLVGFPTAGTVVGVLGGIVSVPIFLYLVTALFFWNFEIIVEDANFVEAMKKSWAQTQDHRLKLFAAGAIIFVISLAVGFATGILGFIGILAGVQAPIRVISTVPEAFMTIVSLAAASEAFNQVRENTEN